MHSLKHYFSATKWDRNTICVLCDPEGTEKATRSSYFVSLNKYGGEIIIRWTYVIIEVLLESGECCWSSKTLEYWIWYTTTNKGNNNKNPRQVWSWWNVARCVERSVQKKEKFLCYGVSASISQFNPSILPPLGKFKENGVCHKTTNTGGTVRSFEHVINDIQLATTKMVCRSVRCHCWECTLAEGGHFEHVQP